MSSTPPPAERDALAAEYALRALEGNELVEAQRRERSVPAFAAEVAAWQERFAPMFEEVAQATPDPSVWRRVQAATGAANDNQSGQARKLRRWRGFGGAAAAIAAALAVVIGFDLGRRQDPAPVAQAERAPVLVAALASEDEVTSLSVAYDGAQGSLLVTPGRLRGTPGRDHELWIIPTGGQPISLGLIRGDEPQRLAIRRELAPLFRQRSAVALSVEPVGGSPTSGPSGPVVASGELLNV